MGAGNDFLIGHDGADKFIGFGGYAQSLMRRRK